MITITIDSQQHTFADRIQAAYYLIGSMIPSTPKGNIKEDQLLQLYEETKKNWQTFDSKEEFYWYLNS